ncbi:hypothetical protein LR48_Vigan01g119400 [Vigna angularis]|uniref:Cyclic dof factor 2 Dof zinc finger protein n=2 Tax=Phaseolus angularis TaxID=3914 RepID=A0A0L9TN95_PHAAN|nr:cyclic dof factor 1 [Vigna angularis]KAG2409536.1 Cyclic dof factor 2 Dof zinc finger protein [Vigna angularis]KOM31639.1 hypothetical protein LR48_Vigan01g119400 [Vigna angularis]BAT74499.1 hypothetical protein VIGAN_01218300 [Vigna angularis var. angularis]
MSEVKGSAIKLFGRTISLPHNDSSAPPTLACPSSSSSPPEPTSATQQHQEDQEAQRKQLTSLEDDDASSHETTEDLKSAASDVLENPKTPSAETETSLQKSPENEEQSETSASEEKTPKKPDNILPCPRCNSMDTKFCYYNNYNVNQPRHFCKNCQRYWTAGGTMRNVPVGAGRRKNKNTSAAAVSHYRQIMMPEAFQGATLNASNGLHNALFGNGAAVLTFGSDTPLCDTMSSVLNIAERAQSCVSNGFHATEPNGYFSYSKEGDGGGHSTGVSVSTTSNSSHASSHESVDKRVEGFTPQLSYFPGAPWPYPMPPTFFQPRYPLSFHTTPAYWSCMPPSWNISCMSSQSSDSNTVSAPILGKHSRNGNIITPSNSQKEIHNSSEHNFLIPKTLRIDDPGEAAKSSMWSKLGTKNDRTSSGGLFQAFPPKGNDMNHRVEASPQLQANPAALSRSLTFHEQT